MMRLGVSLVGCRRAHVPGSAALKLPTCQPKRCVAGIGAALLREFSRLFSSRAPQECPLTWNGITLYGDIDIG